MLAVGILAVGATAALSEDRYEVQPGDTLSKIAGKLDGVSSWRALADANSDIIDDPNLIFPGQRLAMPGSSQAASSSGSSGSGQTSSTSGSGTSNSTSSDTSSNASASASVWDRLAECESNGNWSINTGNGYYGGLQFSLDSWRWVGGSGYPHEASKAEQIARAEILLDRQGWNAWPACSSKLGLR